MRRTTVLAAGTVGACTALLAVPDVAAAQTVRIHEVQGAGRVSPLVGQRVTDVPGVVTGVRDSGDARGFWFQDPAPDADPRTSEGVFVLTGAVTPRITVGDAVRVAGEVAEYYPTAEDETPADTPNQSVTELVAANWRVTGRAPVPAAERVGSATVPVKYAPSGRIEDRPLRPDRFALDYYESREGMNLRVDDARVVGPTDEYGGLWVTSQPGHNANARDGISYTGYADPNPGRLKVESARAAPASVPRAAVGDRLRGVTAGPLDYDRHGGYVLEATRLGAHEPGGLARETTRAQRSGELAVAGYNVENLDPGGDQARFDRLGRHVATNLAGPDILALAEVQDDSGAVDDGVVTAGRTLHRLSSAIARAGGPRYEWRQIDPRDGADGGEPGGNIRNAFLFDPARVSFVDRPGGDAVTPTEPETGSRGPELSVSPGRVEPANPAWKDGRKPLAGEFDFRGRPVLVVANHFQSKGADQPLHARFQPPQRASERQRIEQARVVRGFVDRLRGIDSDAAVIVAGDLNDFAFSPAVRELTAGGALRDAAGELPPTERYGYVHEGNSQGLDHILTSPRAGRAEYDSVHLNAEFADRASDHDPQLVRLAW